MHNNYVSTNKPSGIDLEYTDAELYWRNLMPEPSVMMFDQGFECGIRCRFISEWYKMDSYVYTKGKLLSEIERNRPTVVVMNLDLYAKIDGIEISRVIRNRFDVPVMYV